VQGIQVIEDDMNALLCAVGTRGDVQPILALAIELQAQGHYARLCVPPAYKGWVQSFGVDCHSIWPSMKVTSKGAMELSLDQLGTLAASSVFFEFQAVTKAAYGCDVIVAGGPQLATRSVAEALDIPYVFAAYCPAVLPSTDHPPPLLGVHHHSQSLPPIRSAELWREDERTWNALFRSAVNERRAEAGLSPIESVQHHLFTGTPWLAADSTLAPAAASSSMHILQTGAWLLPTSGNLPDYLEEFLAAGEPPVYFGFGSMPSADDISNTLINAARALGLRSIVAQSDCRQNDNDCVFVEDISHERLLPRVAVIVHHGGAGTTTAAAAAGIAQIVIPHMYDQYYWAHRVQQLGIGVAGPPRVDFEIGSIAAALQHCLRDEVTLAALSLSRRVERHGVKLAAARLLQDFGGLP
jgi:vancomycin aglycone glucosyltransferase